MDIRCEKCGTRYVLDDQRVPEAGATVRCTSCGNVFHVRKQAASAPPPLPPGTPGPAPAVRGTPGPSAGLRGTPGPSPGPRGAPPAPGARDPFAAPQPPAPGLAGASPNTTLPLGTPGPLASQPPTTTLPFGMTSPLYDAPTVTSPPPGAPAAAAPAPGASTLHASPPPGPAAAPPPAGAVPQGTPGPAAAAPQASAVPQGTPGPSRRPDLSAFEASFGVAPSDPDELEHPHTQRMAPDPEEPDPSVLRPAGLGRSAAIGVALLVGAVAVVYLMFRTEFDSMLGIGQPEVPAPAATKLLEARAAARLDTLEGYQKAVKTAQDAIQLAGEVPYPEAWSRIALAYVGWADLMNRRAKVHQTVADASVVPSVPELPPPGCCPTDPAARAGLDDLCAPRWKGGKPCTELEEAARQAAIEAREDALNQVAAVKMSKDKAEANAIRDRADARERLTQALNAARRARSLDPESALATVALAAHERASGDLAGFHKLADPLAARAEPPPPPELVVEQALADEGAERLAHLQKAAAADPNDARVQFHLAETQEAAGRDLEAMAAAEKVMALTQNQHEAASSLLRVLGQRQRRGAAAVEAMPSP